MKHAAWLLLCSAALLLPGPRAVGQGSQSTSPVTATKAGKHHNAKDDLDAIGSRNIGGKGVGNWYSVDQEITMGREYSRAIEAHSTLLQDPMITEYVNRIGQNIVRNSDAKVPFTIKVIDADEVNAFALPGGFLYVNSGLILAAQEEAELAGVMAHEIAHVAAHHATRQITRGQLFNLASIPLIFVGGGIGSVVQEALGLAVPLSVTKFSRSFESEADYLGVEYMYKAGYDPQSFISFFERVQAQEKQKPGLIAKAFSDHPQTTDRIHKTQTEIAKILPPREAYVISTSEFEEVKARLREIDNRRPSNDGDPSRPTLRRKTGDEGSDSKDDAHPTLKRQSDN